MNLTSSHPRSPPRALPPTLPDAGASIITLPTGDGRQSERLLLDGLGKGHIKFVLDGEKLQGESALVRTAKDEKSRLFLKERDR